MRVAVIKKVRCKAKRHKVAQNCSNDMGRRFRVGKTSFGIGVVLGSSLGYPDSITNHLLKSLQKNKQVMFSVMSQAVEAAAVTRLYRIRCKLWVRLCVDTVCVCLCNEAQLSGRNPEQNNWHVVNGCVSWDRLRVKLCSFQEAFRTRLWHSVCYEKWRMSYIC